MTVFEKSLLAWVAGGVAGAALAKKHRVAGFAAGALVLGVVADVVIERNDPNYVGLLTKNNRFTSYGTRGG